MSNHTYILTLSCHDKPGIVAAVTGFLAEQGGFILESAQFGDPATEQFFLRCQFTIEKPLEAVRDQFMHIAMTFSMDWQLHDKQKKTRTAILVSKQLHCLNDLLHRYKSNLLPIEIPVIISNHAEAEQMANWYEIPFYHLPVTPETKADQEAALATLLEENAIELTVLARYMQILSPALTQTLAGKAINIHHSFLPSFKGAKPYHQAYDRGVKIIGATAHYVTDALDEGPIIEQEVTHVTHAHSPEQLVTIGQDIETRVLARSVKYHVENKVLINSNKTVVFS